MTTVVDAYLCFNKVHIFSFRTFLLLIWFLFLSQSCHMLHQLRSWRNKSLQCWPETCVFAASPDQTSPWRCEKLIFVCCVRFHRRQRWDLSWFVLMLREWIITKHAADGSCTKAALTSSLLVASGGRSWSPLTRLTQKTSHHS